MLNQDRGPEMTRFFFDLQSIYKKKYKIFYLKKNRIKIHQNIQNFIGKQI